MKIQGPPQYAQFTASVHRERNVLAFTKLLCHLRSGFVEAARFWGGQHSVPSRTNLSHFPNSPHLRIKSKTSDKMHKAIYRHQTGSVHAGGTEHCGNGSSSLSRRGRCYSGLGAVGRGPGLDTVGMACFGRHAAGSWSHRLLAHSFVVRKQTSESKLNAFSPRRRRICSFL